MGNVDKLKNLHVMNSRVVCIRQKNYGPRKVESVAFDIDYSFQISNPFILVVTWFLVQLQINCLSKI